MLHVFTHHHCLCTGWVPCPGLCSFFFCSENRCPFFKSLGSPHWPLAGLPKWRVPLSPAQNSLSVWEHSSLAHICLDVCPLHWNDCTLQPQAVLLLIYEWQYYTDFRHKLRFRINFSVRLAVYLWASCLTSLNLFSSLSIGDNNAIPGGVVWGWHNIITWRCYSKNVYCTRCPTAMPTWSTRVLAVNKVWACFAKFCQIGKIIQITVIEKPRHINGQHYPWHIVGLRLMGLFPYWWHTIVGATPRLIFDLSCYLNAISLS